MNKKVSQLERLVDEKPSKNQLTHIPVTHIFKINTE
jgi:hypothetical protein